MTTGGPWGDVDQADEDRAAETGVTDAAGTVDDEPAAPDEWAGADEAAAPDDGWEEVALTRRAGQARMVRIRGGTPVTPIGGPEPLDLDRHPRATVAAVVAVVALFLLASFAIGQAFRDGEHNVDVPRVPVPRVVGRTLDEAQRELGPLKLLVAVDYQPNEVVPAGIVFDQKPVAGSKLEIGTEVTLVVSDGPAGLTVPDVKGLQGGEAAGLLQALGFAPTVQPVYDESIRPGEVVGTNPAAGNRAVLGAPVAVLVSNGPAPHVVPAVVGQPQAEGMAAIGRSGVGLGKVTTEYVAGATPGVILSTDPAPGSSVPRDFPVDVVVSAPPASLAVPPVTGLLQASAASVLSSTSFPVSYVSQTVPYGDARAGRVLSQSVPAGTKVDPATPLQLTVGVAAPPPTTTTVPGTTTTVPG